MYYYSEHLQWDALWSAPIHKPLLAKWVQLLRRNAGRNYKPHPIRLLYCLLSRDSLYRTKKLAQGTTAKINSFILLSEQYPNDFSTPQMSSQRSEWRERLHANPSQMGHELAIKLEVDQIGYLTQVEIPRNHSRPLLPNRTQTLAGVCRRPGPSWNITDGQG